MRCEKCNKREATVFFSEVKNKKKLQHCLCETCAHGYSQYIEEPSFSYSLQTLIGHFLEVIASKTEEEATNLKCKNCGTTYQEFRKRGRFGCENDYNVFQAMLHNLFVHIHGASKHTGKIPHMVSQTPKNSQEIEILQKLLTEAIAEENYEEAASIRDKIKMLEGIRDEPQ